MQTLSLLSKTGTLFEQTPEHTVWAFDFPMDEEAEAFAWDIEEAGEAKDVVCDFIGGSGEPGSYRVFVYIAYI
jgi:hypothetical protein